MWEVILEMTISGQLTQTAVSVWWMPMRLGEYSRDWPSLRPQLCLQDWEVCRIVISRHSTCLLRTPTRQATQKQRLFSINLSRKNHFPFSYHVSFTFYDLQPFSFLNNGYRKHKSLQCLIWKQLTVAQPLMTHSASSLTIAGPNHPAGSWTIFFLRILTPALSP